MNNRFYKRLARVALMLTLTLLALGSARQAAAETRNVLVVPFSIHADKDLTFLRKGITAMLSSRLTDVGKVVVMDQMAAEDIVRDLPTPLTRETAAEAGRKAGADGGRDRSHQCFCRRGQHPDLRPYGRRIGFRGAHPGRLA